MAALDLPPNILDTLVHDLGGKKKVAEWEAWIAAERWDEFVEDILLNHYDSAYAEAAKRSGRDDENANDQSAHQLQTLVRRFQI